MKNGQTNLYNQTTKCPFCSTQTINLNAIRYKESISKEEERKKQRTYKFPVFLSVESSSEQGKRLDTRLEEQV